MTLDKFTIKQLRVLGGFNQQQMATKLNMSYNTYIAKELGRRKWKYEEVENVSKVFMIPLERISIE